MTMNLALLADIGSTYTKVLAVDLDDCRVLCRSFGLTTADEDISIGLEEALQGVTAGTGLQLHDFTQRLACSSAAGGLQMAAVGLVPELTAEAARLASLGAGAKVIKTYSYRLNRRDIQDLEERKCDIILLAGGTDGGEQDTIVFNAEKLAESAIRVPIVAAGNREAADEVEDILRRAGKDVYVTDNVLPSLRQLNIDPARKAIRDIFMKRIVYGKGFHKAQDLIGTILMPTPAAVLEAATLLAEGWDDQPGWGDLMVVDIGGATTDIHSVADGKPTTPNAVMRGLPEPKVKRTVEGDLGLRVSAGSLLDAAGPDRVCRLVGGKKEEIQKKVDHLSRKVDFIPASKEDALLEMELAKAAVQIAVNRHAGQLDKLVTPSGAMFIQTGKDLSRVPAVIGTGGIFAHTKDPKTLLNMALFDRDEPHRLKPVNPVLYADRSYIFWGMGLLATMEPTVAMSLLTSEIERLD